MHKAARNIVLILIAATATTKNIVAANDADVKKGHLSMIGGTHIQYDPMFQEIVPLLEENLNTHSGRGLKSTKAPKVAKATSKVTKKSKSPKTTKTPKSNPPPPEFFEPNNEDIEPISSPECDPADVVLLDYPQWEAEKGYWIGEYTFLKGDGDAFVSSSWNYPYDHYKGFITGEVVGNSYRQRNVFLYPPQTSAMCAEKDNQVTGNGVCGTNGNTKVFMADQSATSCSLNEELGGDIAGLYAQGPFQLPTKTELIGKDNALLYQVFIPGFMFGMDEDILLQSQLTTITTSPQGQVYRTRTAQSFDAFVNVGVTDAASYYRERRVNATEFYTKLQKAIDDYDILDEDLCAWDGSGNAIANVTGSFDACFAHLESSFDLGSELA